MLWILSQGFECIWGGLYGGAYDDLDLSARIDVDWLVPHIEVVEYIIDGNYSRVHLFWDGAKVLEGPESNVFGYSEHNYPHDIVL